MKEQKSILIIGSLNIDFVVHVDEMPVVGETLMCKNMELIPGGKGANQAYAIGKLGGRADMLGAVGNDSYADILLNSLKEAGVSVSNVMKRDTANTGLAWITVNCSGDNNIIVVPGANHTLSKEDINNHIDEINNHDIIILQMEIPLDVVVYAAKTAKEAGKTVILDPAPAPRDFPVELYQYIDIIKPNETELSILTDMEDAEQNLGAATDKLKEYGVPCVIVTRGSKGVFVNDTEEESYFIPGVTVKAVDSTAAGDTFTAALAVCIANGKSIAEAVRYANVAASIAVTKKGAQSSIPTYIEVEKIIIRK